MENQEYDEIDLMDYVIVLIKRKYTIIFITLIAVIVATIVSFTLSSVYKIDTVLEIGQVESLLEKPDEIKHKVEGGIYALLIRNKLEIAEQDYPEIKVEHLEGSNFIDIIIESKDPELAQEILKQKNQLILKEHSLEFKKEIEKITQEVQDLQAEVNFLKDHKVYADQGIASLQIRLLQKRQVLESAKETEIIKNPTVYYQPIKPNKKLNIVIAGMLGLFLGIFCAFFREWWRENKKRI